MRACIHTVDGNKVIKCPAGRHVLIAEFAGRINLALDSDGDIWGQLIEFNPRKAYSIETFDGYLEIENHSDSAGKIAIGKA